MPLREHCISLIRELRKFSDDVRRIHPEHSTPQLFAEFQSRYIEMSNAFQDLLIMIAPGMDKLEEAHRQAELERWFMEAMEETPHDHDSRSGCKSPP